VGAWTGWTSELDGWKVCLVGSESGAGSCERGVSTRRRPGWNDSCRLAISRSGPPYLPHTLIYDVSHHRSRHPEQFAGQGGNESGGRVATDLDISPKTSSLTRAGSRYRSPQPTCGRPRPNPQAQEGRPRAQLVLHGRQVPRMLPDHVSVFNLLVLCLSADDKRFYASFPILVTFANFPAPSSPTPPPLSSAVTALPSSANLPVVRPS
jgi:hypothetical protein